MRSSALTRFLAASLLAATSWAAEPASEDEWADAWGDEGGDWSESWDEDAQPSESGLPINGFIEGASGWFTRSPRPVSNNQSLSELRARVELNNLDSEPFKAKFKLDIWHDDVLNETRGELREANVRLSPVASIDMVIGRQTQTWGTGDLLFLNDLFPKDWQSFFAGRDMEYLKAPSDSVRITQYNDIANIDLSWSPVFEPDRHLTGERFSYFSPAVPGQVAAPLFEIDPILPSRRLNNGEIAVRFFRQINNWETALYGYKGYFKQPLAFNPAFGRYEFPKMQSIGASARGNILGGLLNLEASHYYSMDDEHGSTPLIPNDQDRLLVGFERELMRNVTMSFQYYLERIGHYRELKAASPWPQFEQTERRHVVTNRIRWSLMQQKLTLGNFVFYSPDEKDWFALPSIHYRASDEWQFEIGARVFGGSTEHTFLGQHKSNSNAYARIRYSFRTRGN